MSHALVLRTARGAGGRPLLCLHGFLGSPESFRELAASLRHPGSILGVVLPGHGLPPRRVISGEFLGVAAELARELEEPAYLLGYSLGARLALGMACVRPERVLGVIALGARLGLCDEVERTRRRAWERALQALLERSGLGPFVEYWEALPLFDTQRALPADVLARQRELRLSHDATALARVLDATGLGGMPELAPKLARLPVPVVLCAGRLDARAVTEAERVCRIAPGARAHVIEGAGHNPLLEAPAKLARFIDAQLSRWNDSSQWERRP